METTPSRRQASLLCPDWPSIRFAPPMSDELMEYEGRYWTLTGKRLPICGIKPRMIVSLFSPCSPSQRNLSPREDIPLCSRLIWRLGYPRNTTACSKTSLPPISSAMGSSVSSTTSAPISILINSVRVFPQAYAAVVPESSKVVHTLRVFVIDIGGYTTDVLLLRNGKPDLQYCRSLETGIITMHNEIVRKVNALHDMRIEDEHISAVLRGQETILPPMCRRRIRAETQKHAKRILDELRELQVDLRSNPAIFIGRWRILVPPVSGRCFLICGKS